VDPELLARASADAERAAARGGVEVRALHSLDELAQARHIWDVVWPTAPGATEVTQNLLRAIEHAGGYVGGAYLGDLMVGSCLAIVGRSRGEHGWHTHLHSHVAAALPGYADRGIGTSLKLHQRAWALGQDIDRIVWTFDPLVRRNARLNLVKLGGVAREYLVDFYGVMDDALNAGDESDRLLLQWDLASSRVASALAGERPALPREEWLARGATERLACTDDGSPRLVDASSAVVLVAAPDDIVDIRRFDLALAKVWRLQVRAALEPLLRAGGEVVGLTTDGSYVVEVGS
jgi:predicted GNAT superfamily acetyltransferase